MLIRLTDPDVPEAQPYFHLTEAQLRSREGLMIVEGVPVIRHALDAGCEPVSFLMEEKHLTGKAAGLLARCPEVPVLTGDSALLARLTGYSLSRGVLCAMRRPAPQSPLDICRGARRVAVLEGITDGTNVGAILRSAAALGVDAVLLDATCCDPLGRRAIRVSMGTVFQVPWAVCESWVELLHGCGFQLAALALAEDAVPIGEPALKAAERLALVLGTEGSGLREETIAACDWKVIIPMLHGVDSLNVAAASAVAFWETGKALQS